MAKWYIHKHDREEGPFSAGDMRRMVDSGEVTETTMIRKDRHKTFLAAKSFQGLIKSDAASNKSAKDELELDLDDEQDVDTETVPVANDAAADAAANAPKVNEHNTTMKDGDAMAGMQTTMATGDLGGPPTELIDTKTTIRSEQKAHTVRTERIHGGVPRWLLLMVKLYVPVAALLCVALIIVAVQMS